MISSKSYNPATREGEPPPGETGGGATAQSGLRLVQSSVSHQVGTCHTLNSKKTWSIRVMSPDFCRLYLQTVRPIINPKPVRKRPVILTKCATIDPLPRTGWTTRPGRRLSPCWDCQALHSPRDGRSAIGLVRSVGGLDEAKSSRPQSIRLVKHPSTRHRCASYC